MNLIFFVYAVISDLYLFQESVFLNPCLIFSKNLISSLIGKLTTGAQSLALFFETLLQLLMFYPMD